MVTISRMRNGRRVRASGTTREEALANLERSMRWMGLFRVVERLRTSVWMFVKSAAPAISRIRGVE
jgi:hypothetical protein